jgi:hypothetical protein
MVLASILYHRTFLYQIKFGYRGLSTKIICIFHLNDRSNMSKRGSALMEFKKKGVFKKLCESNDVPSGTDRDVISNDISIERYTCTKPIVCHQYSDAYIKNIVRVQEKHQILCQQLKIQKREKSFLYPFLKQNNYLVSVHPHKKKERVEVSPYPLRMTFFNGGKSHFPYSVWKDIFRLRRQDIEANNLVFDNDFALSDEGVKFFVELDYQSREEEPSEETLVAHARVCHSVVREYFPHNTDVSYWILTCTPKPKYLKDELHPIISSGAHIIFRNIVLTTDQCTQLANSVKLRLEVEFGLVDTVDMCYKKNMASLRGIYCRKLETCLDCLDDNEMRINCETCLCRGRVPSGSIYTASYLFDSDNKNMYPDVEAFDDYVRSNLEYVIGDTSIIPESINLFTQGYEIPEAEPLVITSENRSKNGTDVGLDFVYKQDRKYLSQRRKERFTTIVDVDIIRLVTSIVRCYHPKFDTDNMLVSGVSKNNGSLFVDLRGSNRTFCLIQDENGIRHTSNRVFFRIDQKSSTITQHCYNDTCRKLSKSVEIRKRLTRFVDPLSRNKLFASS